MTKTIFAVASLASAMLLGCGGGTSTADGGISFGNGGSGGSSGDNSCSFTPCGGSLLGTWHISGFCLSNRDAGSSTSLNDAGCSTTANVQKEEFGGTFTFRNDGTYTIDFTLSSASTVTYSAPCLTGSFSCAALDTTYKSGGITDAGFSGSCSTVAGGSCVCSESFNEHPPSEDGTYSTSGTTVTSVPKSTGTPDTSDYCVQGNTLKLRSTSSSSSSDVSATLTATQ